LTICSSFQFITRCLVELLITSWEEPRCEYSIHFAPLINISLEELVPQDHFYRHLERTLDLSFVRELVQETYAGGGRPSIDPVVFFKLQLVMFFEGLRSERQLMRHAADRLSVRWYLGYDLGEPLPDHSSLTRIRERYGVDIFGTSSLDGGEFNPLS
jgi:transposase